MRAIDRFMYANDDTRNKLKRLREICDSAKNISVIIYANPDPDALASALALKKILDTKKNAVNIGYTGAIGRPENASMIRRLKIPAFPISEAEAGDSAMRYSDRPPSTPGCYYSRVCRRTAQLHVHFINFDGISEERRQTSYKRPRKCPFLRD
jgi:hypothetical protein